VRQGDTQFIQFQISYTVNTLAVNTLLSSNQTGLHVLRYMHIVARHRTLWFLTVRRQPDGSFHGLQAVRCRRQLRYWRAYRTWA